MDEYKNMCKVITSGYCPYADGVDEDVKSCADCPWYNPEAEQRFFEEVTRMADRGKVFDAIRNCVTEPKCKDKDCPWKKDCEKSGCKRTTVPVTLLLDTLNLLKEQPQWISVKDRMPAETHSMFYKFYGTLKWRDAMWREESDHVLVAITFEDGSQFVTSGYTQDGKWSTGISKILQYTVTHWMPLPEPPEVKQDD